MVNQPEIKRTIFLVEEDDETRTLMKGNLRKDDYHVLPALDEEDAHERVRGGRLSADLILVDIVGVPPDEALRAGRRIRQVAELNVPLVIMAEKYGADLEGTDASAGDNDWITYLGDHEQLRNLLARLI